MQFDKDFKAPVRAMYLITLMVQIAVIVLFAYFIHYFKQLKQEQCTCALSWRTKLLQFVLMGMILIMVARMFLRGKWDNILSMVALIMSLTFILVTFQFSMKVRKDQCECAMTPAFRVLDIVNMVQVFLLMLYLFFYVVGMILVYLYARKLTKASRK